MMCIGNDLEYRCSYRIFHFGISFCMVVDDSEDNSELFLYCMNWLCFCYGRWDHGVRRCEGLELQSARISMMCNNEMRK